MEKVVYLNKYMTSNQNEKDRPKYNKHNSKTFMQYSSKCKYIKSTSRN